jgi:hypothetical protein
MERLGLKDRWIYRDAKRRHWGLTARQAREIISQADLLFNLSGVSWFEGFERIPQRVYVDEDPAFTQINAAHDPKNREFLSSHTHLFSYGRNIGKPGCTVPTLGLQWQTCCQPVVLREWPLRFTARAAPFTTVMNWTSYSSVRFRGETYGQKSVEFRKILKLPALTTQFLEVAVRGDVATKKLTAYGWRIAEPLAVSRTVDTYRDYIRRSRGEFSIAKNGYVKMRSGWFSDRSATYLASGKPVVLQDTGYSQWLPVGEGLVAFNTVEEAAAALETVNGDYRRHCRAARAIAIEYFDSRKVLRQWLHKL